MVDVGFGRMKATILVRGERPYRETKVVFEAQASEQKLEEMGSSSYSRPAVREAVVHGQMLFVMGIMKAQDDGWRRGAKPVFRDWRRVFGQDKTVEQANREVSQIVVREEPLDADHVFVGETIWRWTDDGDGGDMVRAMSIGDALELRSNMRVSAWCFRILSSSWKSTMLFKQMPCQTSYHNQKQKWGNTIDSQYGCDSSRPTGRTWRFGFLVASLTAFTSR